MTRRTSVFDPNRTLSQIGRNVQIFGLHDGFLARAHSLRSREAESAARRHAGRSTITRTQNFNGAIVRFGINYLF
jgi:hypothetical protein